MKHGSRKKRAKQAGAARSSGARAVAVDVLSAVLVNRRSLATAKSLADSVADARDRALAMELVYGVLRWRIRLEALLAKLLRKPLKPKDQDLQLILLVALYELIELHTPDYAVVNEAVAQSRRIGKQWASSMVNAVLRNFLREREGLMAAVDRDRIARLSHPAWLVERIEQDWPDAVERILAANNGRPPMWLRVNLGRVSVEDYSNRLMEEGLNAHTHPLAKAALKLESPLDVSRLPGFSEGLVSVQDASAQLAAGLLDVTAANRVLDVCAAPGGKTCHVLEAGAELDMTAVELEPSRLLKVQQNLDRLGLRATLVVADASRAGDWWDGQPFDRILVDAPCSATGVIRRHPDIKSLRQPNDLQSLADTQHRILAQSWQMLRPGGVLLYVTCSILRQENEAQIARLLSEQPDAAEVPIEAAWGISCRHGRQLLPGDMDGDGFYFARLEKRANPAGDTAFTR